MKLSVKGIALTAGLLWGGAILFIALVNQVHGSYGQALLELCSSIYPGYHASPTIWDACVGALYGVIDGAIGGALFAWLYNLFAS